VRLDKDFQVNPGAATEWSVDESGLVWTFKLDPDLMWNDGTPVTADDYVATFRYGADPEHAWDFSSVLPGGNPQLDPRRWPAKCRSRRSVWAVDAQTLEFTTEAPAPFLPAMLVYSATFQKAALEAHGGLYNSNPETSVFGRPVPTCRVDQRPAAGLCGSTRTYKGTNVPYIERIVVVNIGQPSQLMPAYEANEIDFVNGGGTLRRRTSRLSAQTRT
jgi:ABC-type transport system substrate-binding protein